MFHVLCVSSMPNANDSTNDVLSRSLSSLSDLWSPTQFSSQNALVFIAFDLHESISRQHVLHMYLVAITLTSRYPLVFGLFHFA